MQALLRRTVTRVEKKVEEPTEKLTDTDLMPYGIHKGEKMANVPATYLLIQYKKGNSCHEGVKNYVEENLQIIEREAKDPANIDV